MERLVLPDGRTLEYLVDGPPGGLPLVLHHGTPSGAVRYAPIFDSALRHGLRIVLASRPGYGGSSPHPGRRVSDVAADTAALLDGLEAAHFVTVGWSGGGPHALACAALLPGRCAGAATIGGVAPYSAPGLDWLDGMGAENVAEFEAAAAGVASLDAFLTGIADPLARITAPDVIEAYGDLLSEVDKRALTDGLDDYLAESTRYSVSAGIAGWREDDLAFLADWGFPLTDIRVPLAIWQGEQDRMVPPAHGHWLAGHIPGAEVHLLPDEGHLSLIAGIDTIVENLLAHVTV
ncbi:alpha/beta hydrolase [Actinoplanes bogorensis]|uniref:Alpha/beta hydrolase n=1 Tax=Paractinoplanes bogorensis TaxID=1610840 RepID=A0ABS5YH81_9ACTN|nr:alpha/beta hydrolase [Actinoplanes bogorensis]MBU2662755.1 alpha/beta hydrolase [Actinoplanes bogorensis]